MHMQCQRTCKENREFGQRTLGTTADVQGYYPNVEQTSAEEEVFVVSKVSESQMLNGRRCLGAAWFQMLTTMALSEKIRI